MASVTSLEHVSRTYEYLTWYSKYHVTQNGNEEKYRDKTARFILRYLVFLSCG